jgi:hypothetical protein
MEGGRKKTHGGRAIVRESERDDSVIKYKQPELERRSSPTAVKIEELIFSLEVQRNHIITEKPH